MRKRTIDVLEDCIAVLENAEIEDTDALIGQLKAEIALYRAKAAVREAFENADAPVGKPKPTKKSAHKPTPTSGPPTPLNAV